MQNATARPIQDETFQSLATAVEQMTVTHRKDGRDEQLNAIRPRHSSPTVPAPCATVTATVAASLALSNITSAATFAPAAAAATAAAAAAAATAADADADADADGFAPVPYIVPIITSHFDTPAHPDSIPPPLSIPQPPPAPSASYFTIPALSALTSLPSRSISSAMSSISSPLTALYHQMTTHANDQRHATTLIRQNESAPTTSGDNVGGGIGIAADNDYFNVKMAMVTVDCLDEAESHVITHDNSNGADDDMHHAGWIVMTATRPRDDEEDDDEDDGVEVACEQKAECVSDRFAQSADDFELIDE